MGARRPTRTVRRWSASPFAQEGDEVVITVADNGVGVPESERTRVQERFVRLEASRSTPGTGLGLSLAAAAVKIEHGTIELGDAKPGLLVTLRLPAAGAVTTGRKGRGSKPATLREAINTDLHPLDAKAAKAWLRELAEAGREAGIGRRYRRTHCRQGRPGSSAR